MYLSDVCQILQKKIAYEYGKIKSLIDTPLCIHYILIKSCFKYAVKGKSEINNKISLTPTNYF